MQSQDARRKTKSDAFSTLSTLNCALKIFGLSCIYRDGDKLKHNRPILTFLFYIIYFFISNAYSIYFIFQNHKNNAFINFEDSIQTAFLFGYIQYIFDIVFVYKYGRQTNVDYFLLYDYIDNVIGIALYNNIKNTIRKMCLFFTCIAIISIIIDYCTWIARFTWITMFTYSVESAYLFIRLLTALDGISNWIQVKYRLQTIGDILQNYYYNTDNLPGVVKNVIHDKVWISTQGVTKSNNLSVLKTVLSDNQNIFQWLSRCYILLNEQCDFINIKYGFRTLFFCVLYLLDMVLLMNLMIRLLVGTMEMPNGSILLPMISTTARVTGHTLIIFCGVYYCEQNYRQTERIIKLVDNILINKNNTKEVQETLRDLKSLILSRPINFHAIHFFRLDYALLVSMASVIVTYTIILLQNMQ